MADKATEFVTRYLDAARATQQATGVPALLALAQAGLESGWGCRAPGNNLFGIRADRSWHGPVVDITTHEVVNGTSELQHGQGFRAYPDAAASFRDWADFLRRNPRYHAALNTSGNPQSVAYAKAWARAIAAAGYSTSPAYADQLCACIDSVARRIPA